MCAVRHRFKGTPQHQAINGLISASYATKEGDIKTSLKLEPRYENASQRAVYDLTGEGLPFQTFTLEKVDRLWFIAE